MKVVAVRYETKDGSKKEAVYLSYVTEINLSGSGIQSIEFSGLRHCQQLESLNLGYDETTGKRNYIESIDLSALSSCTELKFLNLGGNNLSELDTTILARFKKLTGLFLEWNDFEELNLSTLSTCNELEELNLSNNKLRDLNLAPLSNCTFLRRLDLSGNWLRELDLTPLSAMTELEYLDLSWNKLQGIGLSYFSRCDQLEELHLGHNHLKELDLAPLSSCRNLESLDVGNNALERLDLSPLLCTKIRYLSMNKYHTSTYTLFCRHTVEKCLAAGSKIRMKFSDYNVPIPIHNLELMTCLASIIEKHESGTWKTRHLSTSLVETAGIEGVGFLDIDLATLQSILNRADSISVRRRVVDAYCAQIERGGTTIGTDAEFLARGSSAELAKLVPQIIALRKKEIEAISGALKEKGSRVNLKPLWLTAYGYQILSALGLGFECTVEKFQNLSDAFSEIGFDLETTLLDRRVSSPTRMSDEMKQYIFFLAEYSSQNRLP